MRVYRAGIDIGSTTVKLVLLDENENIIQSWKFDYPIKKRFSDPGYYDDDCLVCYLMERFNLPTIGYRAPK